MTNSILLRPSCPSLLSKSHTEPHQPRKPSSLIISCSSSRNQAQIPKLEPFSRSKFDRAIQGPTLIEKCENELSDYCSTLEGDESYGCWRAYFELKDLEKETPKGDVEKLILQAGGIKSLVGCLHGIAGMHKGKTFGFNSAKPAEEAKAAAAAAARERQLCSVPDGLPKSAAEMEEEEKSKMPDSAFTRLLRNKGTHPAWYSQAPDHETD